MNSLQTNGPTQTGILAGLPERPVVNVQVELVARDALLDNELRVDPTALSSMLRSLEDRRKLRRISRDEIYEALLAAIAADDQQNVLLTIAGLAATTWLRASRAERRLLRESIAADGNRAWVVIGPTDTSVGPWQARLPTRFAMNNWRLHFGEVYGYA